MHYIHEAGSAVNSPDSVAATGTESLTRSWGQLVAEAAAAQAISPRFHAAGSMGYAGSQGYASNVGPANSVNAAARLGAATLVASGYLADEADMWADPEGLLFGPRGCSEVTFEFDISAAQDQLSQRAKERLARRSQQ